MVTEASPAHDRPIGLPSGCRLWRRQCTPKERRQRFGDGAGAL